VKLVTLDRLIPSEHYTQAQISPHFWPNGKMPEREDWQQLAADNFKEFRLKVGGLVENPVEWSLEDLRALGKDEFITMHHCIQGWSGIAQWGGLSMKKLIETSDLIRSARSAMGWQFCPAARQ
jgi:methionine sulfoxide reductase catalytic subunit